MHRSGFPDGFVLETGDGCCAVFTIDRDSDTLVVEIKKQDTECCKLYLGNEGEDDNLDALRRLIGNA